MLKKYIAKTIKKEASNILALKFLWVNEKIVKEKYSDVIKQVNNSNLSYNSGFIFMSINFFQREYFKYER